LSLIVAWSDVVSPGMDDGLQGLLSVRAVALQDKSASISHFRNKPSSSPCIPSFGRSLCTALVFSRSGQCESQTTERREPVGSCSPVLDKRPGSSVQVSNEDVQELPYTQYEEEGPPPDCVSSPGLHETSSAEQEWRNGEDACSEDVSSEMAKSESEQSDGAVMEDAVCGEKRVGKRRKKKKRSRVSAQTCTEQVIRKPAVPRFPHPSVPPEEIAVPLVEPPTSQKEPLAKHLMLGRFPKRPLVVGLVLPQSADEGMSLAEPRASPPSRIAASNRSKSETSRRETWLNPEKPVVTSRTRLLRDRPQPSGEDTDMVVGNTRQRHGTTSLTRWPQVREYTEGADAGLGALYFSFSSMRNEMGQKILLRNRQKVVRILHELQSKVAIPLCRHFNIRYNFFSEHHCQAKKSRCDSKRASDLAKENRGWCGDGRETTHGDNPAPSSHASEARQPS